MARQSMIPRRGSSLGCARPLRRRANGDRPVQIALAMVHQVAFGAHLLAQHHAIASNDESRPNQLSATRLLGPVAREHRHAADQGVRLICVPVALEHGLDLSGRRGTVSDERRHYLLAAGRLAGLSRQIPKLIQSSVDGRRQSEAHGCGPHTAEFVASLDHRRTVTYILLI